MAVVLWPFEYLSRALCNLSPEKCMGYQFCMYFQKFVTSDPRLRTQGLGRCWGLSPVDSKVLPPFSTPIPKSLDCLQQEHVVREGWVHPHRKAQLPSEPSHLTVSN